MNNASGDIKAVDGRRFEWRVGGDVDYHSCQLLRRWALWGIVSLSSCVSCHMDEIPGNERLFLCLPYSQVSIAQVKGRNQTGLFSHTVPRAAGYIQRRKDNGPILKTMSGGRGWGGGGRVNCLWCQQETSWIWFFQRVNSILSISSTLLWNEPGRHLALSDWS